MNYLLLISLIVLFFWEYYLFNKELFQPAIIMCSVYIVSVVSALYNQNRWGMNLHYNTVIVILAGNFIFAIVSYIIQKMKTKKIFYKEENSDENKSEFKEIQIQKILVIITNLFAIAFSMIYINSIFNLANSFGEFDSFNKMMANYRMMVSYDNYSLPFLINQCNKIVKAISYIYIYIFIYNILVTKSIKKYVSYLVVPIIYVVTSLLSAERATTLGIFIYVLCLTYILLNKVYYKEKNQINKKYVRRGIICVILFFAFFSFSRSFTGRLNKQDPISYITSYAGGSIVLLDKYLQNPSYSEFFGAEIFQGLYKNLDEIGLVDVPTFHHLEFGYSNGVLVGNTYTSFRTYIHDFGYLGLVVIQIIEAVFYTIFYEKIKKEKHCEKISLTLVLYAILMQPLFLHSISEQLIRTYLCFNTIVLIVLLYIVKWFYTKVRVVYGRYR